MKIISELGKDKLSLKKPFLAIGVFDGLHRGHQALIKNVVERARKSGGQSAVMTFDPHPVHVLHPEIDCPLIISLPHRLKLIAALGVDACLVIHFTKSFAQLSPGEFVKTYLVNEIRPKEIFVGDDFRFGQNRSGDLEYFKKAAKEYGFKVNIVRAVKGNNRAISSTRIRRLIAEGHLNEAQKLLGRRVSVMGKVISGDSRGKLLGFPTANVNPGSEVMPPQGVYLVYVWVGQKRFSGVANLGYRPSFYDASVGKIKTEVHILDFDQNIYGQDIVVEFIKRIRSEKKFPSRDDLIVQIEKDVAAARKYFQSSRSRRSI